MDAFLTHIQPFFAWLLETTVIASMVICLILAAQRLLGKRLGPRWCHALWLVLLLRMVLPWAPPSPLSLRSLIPASIPRGRSHARIHGVWQEDHSDPGQASGPTEPKLISPSRPTGGGPQTAPQRAERAAKTESPKTSALAVVRHRLPLFWLIGTVVLGGYLLAGNFTLWRIVKRERPLVTESILELFERCKSQMGVETIVALVPSDRVNTAALFGFLRPRLLLPRDLIETASGEELRYIFLHELAHLKRHDIYLGWLASLLQILHWFNPLVWLAFHKMRADRELACDALVLTRTGQDESQQYGRTIVGLLERFSCARRLPAMAGILENQSQLKRRIAMIATFRHQSYRWSPAALVLIVALACVSLINAQGSGIGSLSIGNQGADARQAPSRQAEDSISDPNTGLQFRKVCAITGSKDVIEYNTDLGMSPNGRFLSYGKYVIPVGDEDVRPFADLPAGRSSWSPDGTMVAFYSGGIWVVPVSPQTGKPTGPARKLVDDDIYWYHHQVQWSPDSKRFVYEGREGHLMVLSVEDGVATQITAEPTSRRVPGGWSPDGRWIAYWRGDNSICLIPSQGGEPRKLIDVKQRVDPSWSRDGKWILYQFYGGQSLQFVRVADALAVDIAVPDDVGTFLAWSSDGERMVFYRPSFEWTDSLRVVPAAGGAPINPAWGMILSASDHHWSSDSRSIFAWRQYRQEKGYWVVPLSGPAPYPVQLPASVGGTLAQMSLSPKADRVLFSSELDKETIEYWVASISAGTGRPVGTPVKVFDKGRAERPGWSPDESRLSLVCDGDLWIAYTDGRPPVKFTGPSDKKVVGHQWSPDGSAISWITYEPNSTRSTLRVCRLSEDTARDIANTAKYIGHTWSPDGTWIAYSLYTRALGTTRELFIVSAAGGEPRRLMEATYDDYHDAFEYTWCPQGEKLVALWGRRLLTFDAASGQQRQVGGLLDPMWGRCIAIECSPDGQTLALDLEARPRSSDHKDPELRVFTVTLADGKWAEPAGKVSSGYSVRWSPDGKWLSFDCDESIKLRPAGLLWEVDVHPYLDRFTDEGTAPEARPSS
ncbi:M56 family metallopeptidase [Anaerobaca lacustris]|uniref:M56 family metallopeptidase n=1 Tax=Anaerobaca lacustris TaxID=3044600 RepID=A0AAW6U0L8_9BACT|nr:M56 family metallopeptidase [Sedimentisphaerales bacterium M17dextr]